MMELEMLLEEKSSIRDKISQAVGQTKKWFENKIDEARNTFSNIKDKVKSKLDKITIDIFKGKKCEKELSISIKGKYIKLANKGDSSDRAFDKIKKMIQKFIEEIKNLVSKIIKQCSEAISILVTIEKIDYEAIEKARIEEERKQVRLEKIRETKEKVLYSMNNVTEVVIVVGSLIGSIVTLKEVSKRYKNTREGV